jgi:hypothetical protein
VEEDVERYQTLRHAALAHRILQPFAQEELLRILSIRSEEQLITMVELLQGSSRLAEYAKRTEAIELHWMEDEGEGLNELVTSLFEMCCNTKTLYFEDMHLRLSSISKSPAPNSTTQDADLEISSARLTSLSWLIADACRILIDKPASPFARVRRLEFFETHLVDGNGNEWDVNLARSLFSPAQFPALRQMFIDAFALEQDSTRFNLLLPQLGEVDFSYIPLSSVAIQLPHCTSLKKLRLMLSGREDSIDLLPFYDSLRELHLEQFHYWDSRGADGTISLRDVRSIIAIVGKMKTLKKLSLGIHNINTNTVTTKKWIEFKEGVRKLCHKNKVEIVRFSQSVSTEHDELTWVDNTSD